MGLLLSETHIFQQCVEASSCFVDLSFTMILIARMGHNSGVKLYTGIHIGESLKHLLKIKFGYLLFKICNQITQIIALLMLFS